MKSILFAAAFAGTVTAMGAAAQERETIVLAGGCFWCVESDFDHVEGVLDTVSGYAGGTSENPTYEQVSYGETGHYEVVRITYDPSVVGYRELADIFWRTIDPTDDGGQFCDRGSSYRTAVFPQTPDETAEAEASRAAAQEALGEEIVTEIIPDAAFWPAEDYHQNYYQENPVRYNFYRRACGRDATVRNIWGDQAFVHKGS